MKKQYKTIDGGMMYLTDEEAAAMGISPSVAVNTGPSEEDGDLVKKYLLNNHQYFAEADRGANENALAANLGRAGSLIGASIAGTQVDDKGWDALSKQASSGQDQAIDDRKLVQNYLMQKRDSDFKKQQMEREDKKNAQAQQNWEKSYALDEKKLRAQQSETAAKNALLKQGEEVKIAEKKAEQAIPGFSPTGQTKLSSDEVKKARDSVAAFDSMDKNLMAYRDLIKEYGSFEYGGKGGEQMASLATDIRLSLKELANLGVLSKTDYALLDNQLRSPNGLDALFSRDDTSVAQVDQLMTNISQKLNSKMNSLGYVPDTEMAARLDTPARLKSMETPEDGTAIAAPTAPETNFRDMDDAQLLERYRKLKGN